MKKEHADRVMQIINQKIETFEIDLQQLPTNPISGDAKVQKAQILAMYNQLRWLKELLMKAGMEDV